MKITFYLPTKTGVPNKYFWDKGWFVSMGFKGWGLFGYWFLRYSNYRKINGYIEYR